ncbi:hypothetical protein L2E82_43392 [Cichorium intybus]|uniref:Uncharacterized protein n=1 Tax=Cichorium intybus TaxID=13427 RepID=A0ACB8ZT01_CICIN|nr:hypothetical protein L2E82_43392 [Cichorium intybus]
MNLLVIENNVLGSLLQNRLGQMNGVDVGLQAVAMYKLRDARSLDEKEMVENLFDCLCCLLMPLENKESFLKAEGVELMIVIMNQKKLCYGSAIRALDFAMTNYPPASEVSRMWSFVENEYEKIDRLMELYMKYSNRVKEESERMNDLELNDLEEYHDNIGDLDGLNEKEKAQAKIQRFITAL